MKQLCMAVDALRKDPQGDRCSSHNCPIRQGARAHVDWQATGLDSSRSIGCIVWPIPFLSLLAQGAEQCCTCWSHSGVGARSQLGSAEHPALSTCAGQSVACSVAGAGEAMRARSLLEQ